MSNPTKSEMVLEALKENPNPTPDQIKEIAKHIGCSQALVRKMMKKIPKPEVSAMPTPTEPIITIEEEKAKEIEEMPEEAEAPIEVPSEFEKKAVPIEEITAKLEAGILTSEDLTYVWQSVNSLFPTQHQRPQKSMELLGKLWVKPANRLIEKYAVENVDLYLAVGMTILTFAPSIVGVVREARKPKPVEKKEGKELYAG